MKVYGKARHNAHSKENFKEIVYPPNVMGAFDKCTKHFDDMGSEVIAFVDVWGQVSAAACTWLANSDAD